MLMRIYSEEPSDGTSTDDEDYEILRHPHYYYNIPSCDWGLAAAAACTCDNQYLARLRTKVSSSSAGHYSRSPIYS
jgi:hypothetical protein